MGLLDLANDPLMGLAGGLLGGGSFGQALTRGLTASQAMQLGEQERRLRESQALENKARAQHYQDQQRAVQEKLQLDAARQLRIQSILGGGQGGVSPGAFAPSADGMGPTMPPQMSDQARRPGGVIPNLSIDQIAALKQDGVDLTDIYKFAREPQKYEQGSTYENRATGRREYMPKIGDGVAPDGGGFYGALPGYAQAMASIEGAKAGAVAQAQAGQDFVDVPTGNGTTVKMTRAEYARLRQGGGQPQAPTGPRMTPGQLIEADSRSQGFNTPPILSPNWIGERPALPSQLGTTPDPVEQTRRTEQAKADVGRGEANKTKATKADEMLSGIARAKELLGQEPTESTIGAGVDKVLSWGGKSTKSADVAARLETLSGWLVANVPRMEGPQSNFDVENYKTMAGKVGDRTLPVSQRLAAAQEVENLQKKYANLNQVPLNTGGASGEWGAKPAASAPKRASLADIQTTARAQGKSTAEVTKRLRELGYEIGGN